MKKSNNNTWKRIAAGALSLALVAGAMPANVGGFLTGGNVLVASAETQYYTVNAPASVGEATDEYGNKVVVSQRNVGGTNFPVYTATAAQGYKFDHWSCINPSNQHFNDTENPLKPAFELTATAYFVALTAPTVNAATELTYNGTAQALVTAPAGAAIQYRYKKSTDETYSDWSATAPSATDAGTYLVQWYSTANANYAASGSAEDSNTLGDITISPAELTVDNIVAGGNKVNGVPSQLAYTGSEQTVKLYYKNGDTYVPLTAGTDYDLTSFEGHNVGYPGGSRLTTSEATNVGNYSALIVAKGNYKMQENYSNIYAFWSIAKADPAVSTVPTANYADGATSIPYTGQAQALVNAGATSDGTMRYIYKTSDADETDITASGWGTNIPQATAVGTYYVSYGVQGDANHNNKVLGKIPVNIDYANTSLTLGQTLTGAVIVENGATEALEATDGVYTLAGTKKYNIYTNKSIADSTAATALDLTSKSSNKTFGGTTYNYRYEIEVPAIPAEGGYLLSHTNNFVGKVSTAEGKANVMNIQEDGVTTEDVVTLNADGVIYYGDQLDAEELVTIAGGYSNIVNVDEIYIANTVANGGGRVNIDNLTLNGTYVLTAKVTTDTSGDKTDDDTSGNTVYLKQTITFKARPMNKNSYFLQTEDGLVPLEVSDSTVTVPENYWVCTLKDDSSKTYIRTEEPDEAINALFNCTKKSTFVYNGTAQKPVIVVKNGGDNSIVLADTAVAANETATPPVAAVAKDYNNAVEEKTNAGSYNYALTAEANGKYSDSVTVAWSIAKADVSDYITVAPKNNVDTDTVAGNDSIVYDGAVLNGTDFEVKTNEAYAALAADSPVKALVDEFIAQLEATPATETTAAVPAKTVVSNVSATQEQIKALLSSYKDSNGKVTTDTFRRSIVDCDLTIDPYSNTNGNITGAQYISIYNTTTNQTVVNQFDVGATGGTITYNTETHGIQIGETVLTPSEGKYFEIVRSYRSTTGANSLNITGLTITESDLTASVQTTPKNAGDYKVNVTVTNSNFENVVFNDQDVTIAKRNVTLTPDEDLSMTYRDTAMPDLTYSIEEAKADGLTGVIAADKALFQKTTGEGADAVTTNTGAIYVDELVQEDTTAAAVQFVYALDENNAADYTTAGLNNAGSYKYAVINDTKFANYNIVLPVDIAADEAQGIEEYTAPTFTVAPLNLNNIADLQIVLNGVTPGWTQNGNSGSYIYDGSTKQVEVTKVYKKKVEQTESATFTAASITDTSATVNNVQLSWSSKDDNGWNVYNNNNNDDWGNRTIRVTAPEGALIKEIKAYGTFTLSQEDEEKSIFASDYTNVAATTNSEGYFDFADIESNTFTISANTELSTSSTGKFGKIEVTYYYPVDYRLDEGTDYTVGGATKRASSGTHNVQIVGKGNYTGVVKAPWNIVDAEAGEAILSLNAIQSDGEYDYTKVYDGKAVTGTVTFNVPDSDYALDAEVEYKYYQGIYTKEQVTSAGFNATAIDAPVNAYYSDEDNIYHFDADYTVVATITCDGYADQVLVKNVRINPIDLTVNAAAKNITYGDALPAVTQADIDAISGLTDTDKAFFQQLFTDGKLEFAYLQTAPDTYDYNKVRIIPIFTTEDEINAFRNVVFNYNTANYCWNITNKAKSIKDSSITVEFTNSDTIVLNADGTFASDNAIKVYDTAILGADGKATELVELGTNNAATADYELTVESTATEGVYTLELVGKNNYRGIRKVKFTAITAAEAATNLTFAKPYLKAGTTDKIILKNTVETDTEKYEIVKNGYVYYTGEGQPTKELLIENVDATLGIKVCGKAQATYSPTLTDSGNGAYVRPYVIVKDKNTNAETTIYLDTQYVSAAEIAANSATNLTFAKPYLKAGTTDKIILKNTVETDTEKYEIVKNGYVYYTGEGQPTKELLIENVDATLGIKVCGKAQATYSPTLTDSGNGAYVRPYVIVKDKNTNAETTIYLDTQYVSAAEIAANSATNLTFAKPYLKAGTTDKIILKNTVETDTEKYEIVKNGYVYYTGEGQPTKELLIENVDATLGIKVCGKAQATYSPTLTDSGNGAYVRPYVIVKDKNTNAETTIYLDTQYVSAADLSAQ